MTDPQDVIADLIIAVGDLRNRHVYPTYDTTFDEVWERNARCSCGRQQDDCDVLPLLAIVDQL